MLLASPEPDDPQDAVVAKQVLLWWIHLPLCLKYFHFSKFLIKINYPCSFSVKRIQRYLKKQRNIGLRSMLMVRLQYTPHCLFKA